jgi:hypothetical protein
MPAPSIQLFLCFIDLIVFYQTLYSLLLNLMKPAELDLSKNKNRTYRTDNAHNVFQIIFWIWKLAGCGAYVDLNTRLCQIIYHMHIRGIYACSDQKIYIKNERALLWYILITCKTLECTKIFKINY